MTARQEINQQIKADEDFSLTAKQLVFLINAENAMRKAEADDDLQFFRNLAASDEYKALFGEMSIDQAIDRYEFMTGRDI